MLHRPQKVGIYKMDLYFCQLIHTDSHHHEVKPRIFHNKP